MFPREFPKRWGRTGVSLPIHSWSPEDRPRERLRALGPRALSARELLAILIGSGGPNGSALDVAGRLLERFGDGTLGATGSLEGGLSSSPGGDPSGSLRRLAVLPLGALENEPGVGSATASRIVAAIEVGRRVASEMSFKE